MNAKTIAKALGGRRAGAGWVARCPAHDDRTPSLSVRDSTNGKVLLGCHAGCEQERSSRRCRRAVCGEKEDCARFCAKRRRRWSNVCRLRTTPSAGRLCSVFGDLRRQQVPD
jgi:CHC2 zinc finger